MITFKDFTFLSMITLNMAVIYGTCDVDYNPVIIFDDKYFKFGVFLILISFQTYYVCNLQKYNVPKLYHKNNYSANDILLIDLLVNIVSQIVGYLITEDRQFNPNPMTWLNGFVLTLVVIILSFPFVQFLTKIGRKSD